ncbi:reverse transcriptase domain-containing protein [Tanacetum coccineum]
MERHAGRTQYHLPAKDVGERTDPSGFPYGSGAGLILTSPEGTEFTYALRFQFTASNNEAEYEALIDGQQITAQMGVGADGSTQCVCLLTFSLWFVKNKTVGHKLKLNLKATKEATKKTVDLKSNPKTPVKPKSKEVD